MTCDPENNMYKAEFAKKSTESLINAKNVFTKSQDSTIDTIHKRLRQAGINCTRKSLNNPKEIKRIIDHELDDQSKFEIGFIFNLVTSFNNTIKTIDEIITERSKRGLPKEKKR